MKIVTGATSVALSFN
jgi:hypothetical protein